MKNIVIVSVIASMLAVSAVSAATFSGEGYPDRYNQQGFNAAVQSRNDVHQSGQSYIDRNTQPIRQKSEDTFKTWSNQAADWQAKADANQRIWDQTIRAYEVNYNESYSRNWDKFTDNYQKSKKL